MKKTSFALFLLLVAMSLCSCKKSGVNLFVGDYSFKTSGEISIMAETVIDSVNTIIPAVINVSISNDIGQLNICTADKQNNEVIVAINYLNGDVVTTTGFCEGNTIELCEYRRDVLPVSVSTMFSNALYIKIKATGHMYDDKMIVFDMDYSGKATVDSTTFIINDKNIQMVAYRN